MTSGRGIQHAEMFPLINTDAPNPFEIIQIWFNLPQDKKMTNPAYKMIWNENIKHIPLSKEAPDTNFLKLIVGSYDNHQAHAYNKDSWANNQHNYVNIWEIQLDKGRTFTMPALPDQIKVQLYVMCGSLEVDTFSIQNNQLLIYTSDSETTFIAQDHTTFMVFTGRPINEPIRAYGPFVMNTDAEILEAYRDFQLTEFGGWRWALQHHPLTVI